MTPSRRRWTAPLLCVLAASLNSNSPVVDAFAPMTPAKSSRSALDVSTLVPPPQKPSFVDRLLEEVHKTKPSSTIKVKKSKNKKRKLETAPPTTTHDNGSSLELDEQEVRKRKLEWAGRYTSVEALRQTFGGNENKLWGDLQASTARRLYKTLLPRALLELSQLGVGELQPQDLAPLAYQARLAAKLYARERCTVPARIGATLFDGFRQWLKYGKFQAHGMTYDQIWAKYAERICQQTEADIQTEEDVCLKILERSCCSNEGVDKLVLKEAPALEQGQKVLLEKIHAQLEQDMYELLLPTDNGAPSTTQRKRPWSKRNHVLMVRLLARQKRLKEIQEQQEKEVLKP